MGAILRGGRVYLGSLVLKVLETNSPSLGSASAYLQEGRGKFETEHTRGERREGAVEKGPDDVVYRASERKKGGGGGGDSLLKRGTIAKKSIMILFLTFTARGGR